MGRFSLVLTVVPVGIVALYLLALAVNVYTFFRPTTYIPYLYEVSGLTDAEGRPLPGHGAYYEPEQHFRAAVYASPRAELAFSHRTEGDAMLLWRSKVFSLSDHATPLDEAATVNVTLPVAFAHEQQLFAHAYLYPVDSDDGEAGDATKEGRNVPDGLVTHRITELVRQQPLQLQEERSLLSSDNVDGETAPDKQEDSLVAPQEPVAHWVPRLDLDVVWDRTVYLRSAVPLDIHQYMSWAERDYLMHYLPVMDPSPLTVGAEDLVPIDMATLAPQPLKIRLCTTTLGWFRISRVLWASFRAMSAPAAADANQAVAPGGIRISAAEANKFRLMLVDIKPWLLLATLLAAVLHLLFEWLAFKEDVAHWRKLENTAGVSRMSVILEAVSRCMAVVFLWERRRDTSILFIGSACLSAAVELWKVRRVLRASKAIKPAQRNATVDKSKSDNADVPMLTETEQLSRDVDRQSTRTIGLACVPLAIGYAAWSLVFQKHAGFRAWAIDALMAGMYLLGFITLTPQLFLNHRLKSVAAMPLRVFMYRALNTFVDDLFAMVFPMPTLTRLATFRDDIVFVVLLWQWWRYPSRKAEDVEKLKQE